MHFPLFAIFKGPATERAADLGLARDAASDPGSKQAAASNVLPFPVQSEGNDPLQKGLEVNPPDSTRPALTRFSGLMNAPELAQFFRDNHFGLGRRNGANYRNPEALELGRQGIISRFQNTLGDLAERRLTKVGKLEVELIAVGGVSAVTAAQIRLTCENLRRELTVLTNQAERAISGSGWVKEALDLYQAGFLKGLRESVEFDLIAN